MATCTPTNSVLKEVMSSSFSGESFFSLATVGACAGSDYNSRVMRDLGSLGFSCVGATAWPRSVAPSPIFEVDTQNLGHAPSLSNTSAGAMGRVTSKISEI